MEAPPGVACMDTRHPRRLLTSGQAQIPHPLIMTKPQLNEGKGTQFRHFLRRGLQLCVGNAAYVASNVIWRPCSRPIRSRLVSVMIGFGFTRWPASASCYSRQLNATASEIGNMAE